VVVDALGHQRLQHFFFMPPSAHIAGTLCTVSVLPKASIGVRTRSVR
jgi:hypothetical protein